ncbi:MAG: DMT family transporter, partial [Rhodospirillaceae bacterium]
NWPFMKTALAEMPIWWFRTICLFVGGGSLLLIAAATRQRVRLPAAEIPPLMLCTFFGILGWHLLSAYGVTLMEAGRASIIAFTMPVWASLLSRVLLGEPLTKSKLLSLALGVAGLAVLIGPDLVNLQAAPLGALCMLGAALTWGIGTVLLKKFTWSASTSALAGWQLVMAGTPICIGAVLFEAPPVWSEVSAEACFSLGYVLAFPMIFCQWAFLRSVRTYPASLAAISTLGVPVVGTYSSAILLGEPAGLREFVSLVLVCMALMIVLVLPALRQRRT